MIVGPAGALRRLYSGQSIRIAQIESPLISSVVAVRCPLTAVIFHFLLLLTTLPRSRPKRFSLSHFADLVETARGNGGQAGNRNKETQHYVYTGHEDLRA